MTSMLQTFFEYTVYFYSLAIFSSYLFLTISAFFSIWRSKCYRVPLYENSIIRHSVYTPGISIVAPAYNEEKTVIDNVNSLLSLDYPCYEVVLVNDGSKDKTLEKLIEHFELKEEPVLYIERIKTKAPFRKILKSTNPAYKNLVVVDKENGGTKADASNAGINAASYDYFVCTDVDCILAKDALYRVIHPVLNSPHKVIAVSAVMRMANGCEMANGVIKSVYPPKTLIPLFQENEYLRSFLMGKQGWSTINAMPNVSGGFGLFDRSVVINAGGYDPNSFAEDMDLVIRMISYMCDNAQSYRVVQIPYTCCWTEGPYSLSILNRQRTRWARGLLQLFSSHYKLMFNPRYKQLSMLTLPYLFVFELIAPIIEVIGLLIIIYLYFATGLNWSTAWIILLFTYLYAQTVGIFVFRYDIYIGTPYKGRFNYFRLFLVALIEPVIYHPICSFFSLKGYFNYLTQREFKWGNMTRKGFQKTTQPAKA
ncbi:glycosyltransferase family 2 protein [Parabacteroides sp. FAFU027]|uniref:glycosyltransferase family 2 protein n=1 Tax=Parabacteroides sp. FAFU027 TaxID=2922715 RepID=UPI001FAFEE3E|nr:glycosyltransferase [Parabacteroides sp. FAFU027]